jgi:hypothetical protein
MGPATTIVESYLEPLNETDAARRAELVGRVWASDGRWVDPPIEAEGHTAIADIRRRPAPL